jgi:hypothetical protein
MSYGTSLTEAPITAPGIAEFKNDPQFLHVSRCLGLAGNAAL